MAEQQPWSGLLWWDWLLDGQVSAARRCSAHLRSLPPAVPRHWLLTKLD